MAGAVCRGVCRRHGVQGVDGHGAGDDAARGGGLHAAEPARDRPRASGYYGALFATWLVLAALIVEGPRWRSAGFSSGVSPITYLLEQPRLIVRYLRLVFAPAGLVLDYGEPATRVLGSVCCPRPCGAASCWR